MIMIAQSSVQIFFIILLCAGPLLNIYEQTGTAEVVLSIHCLH